MQEWSQTIFIKQHKKLATKSKLAKISNKDTGTELTVQHQETDSPILPVAQLEKLHVFKPEAVDWVINETEKESNYRRSEQTRVNGFIFLERLIGQIFAGLIGVIGVGGGIVVALQNISLVSATLGGVIATATIGALVATFRKKRGN